MSTGSLELKVKCKKKDWLTLNLEKWKIKCFLLQQPKSEKEKLKGKKAKKNKKGFWTDDKSTIQGDRKKVITLVHLSSLHQTPQNIETSSSYQVKPSLVTKRSSFLFDKRKKRKDHKRGAYVSLSVCHPQSFSPPTITAVEKSRITKLLQSEHYILNVIFIKFAYLQPFQNTKELSKK